MQAHQKPDPGTDRPLALVTGEDHVIAGSPKNRLQVAGGKLLPEKGRAGLRAAQTRPRGDEQS